jgi:hypothetical protein
MPECKRYGSHSGHQRSLLSILEGRCHELDAAPGGAGPALIESGATFLLAGQLSDGTLLWMLGLLLHLLRSWRFCKTAVSELLVVQLQPGHH